MQNVRHACSFNEASFSDVYDDENHRRVYDCWICVKVQGLCMSYRWDSNMTRALLKTVVFTV